MYNVRVKNLFHFLSTFSSPFFIAFAFFSHWLREDQVLWRSSLFFYFYFLSFFLSLPVFPYSLITMYVSSFLSLSLISTPCPFKKCCCGKGCYCLSLLICSSRDLGNDAMHTQTQPRILPSPLLMCVPLYFLSSTSSSSNPETGISFCYRITICTITSQSFFWVAKTCIPLHAVRLTQLTCIICVFSFSYMYRFSLFSPYLCCCLRSFACCTIAYGSLNHHCYNQHYFRRIDTLIFFLSTSNCSSYINTMATLFLSLSLLLPCS